MAKSIRQAGLHATQLAADDTTDERDPGEQRLHIDAEFAATPALLCRRAAPLLQHALLRHTTPKAPFLRHSFLQRAFLQHASMQTTLLRHAFMRRT